MEISLPPTNASAQRIPSEANHRSIVAGKSGSVPLVPRRITDLSTRSGCIKTVGSPPELPDIPKVTLSETRSCLVSDLGSAAPDYINPAEPSLAQLPQIRRAPTRRQTLLFNLDGVGIDDTARQDVETKLVRG